MRNPLTIAKMLNRSLLPKYQMDSLANRNVQSTIRMHRRINKYVRFYTMVDMTDWGLSLRFRKASPISGFLFCVSLHLLFLEFNLYLWGIVNKKWIRKYAAARGTVSSMSKTKA